MFTKNCKKGDRKKESATSINGHQPESKAAYAIFHQAVEALTSVTKLDSTVQEKAIAFPTDSRLYNRARERLVRLATQTLPDPIYKCNHSLSRIDLVEELHRLCLSGMMALAAVALDISVGRSHRRVVSDVFSQSVLHVFGDSRMP